MTSLWGLLIFGDSAGFIFLIFGFKTAEFLGLGCRNGSSGKEKSNMNMTKKRETEKILTVDVDGLAAMLSCGRATARKIGEDAGARVNYGRRVLYCVSKIEKYLENVSG
jgi:hypothetical protein